MKNSCFLSLLLLTLISCNSNTDKPADKINQYELQFGALDERKINIKANIYLEGSTLKMVSRPERFFPDIDSWWEIIKVKKIVDNQGNTVSIERISEDTAQLSRTVNGRLELEYELDINFVDRQLPNHNTAVGKSFPEGLFIVGKPLFIFGQYDLKTKVSIKKPEKVKITVPWPEAASKSYIANNLRSFVLSNVIISNHTLGVTDFKIGKLSYSLATLGLDANNIDLIKQMANDVATYYVDTFPVDNEMRYVQLVYGISGSRGGGEAYPYSSASAISKDNPETTFIWRITVFHELFHMWNSHMLKGVAGSSDMEWFQEGFTDYMTEMVLSKTGHIDADQLTAFQNSNLIPLKNRFKSNDEALSILSSGANKGKNYVVVYRGGWLIASWMNTRLKNDTGGQWDLVRLMQHLFDNYPAGGTKALTLKTMLQDIEGIDIEIARDLEIVLNSKDWQTINTITKVN